MKHTDGRRYWTIGAIEICFVGFLRELEIVAFNRRVK